MHHTQAIKEIMILQDVTLVELSRRLGLGSHVAVSNRINSKCGRLDTMVEILAAMGYEVIVRPRLEGNLPEGEYALRRKDYSEES